MAENQRDIENPGDDGGNEAQGPYHQIICKAAKRGDWESAKQILDINVKYACDRITKGGDRALHIAAAGKHSEFVKQLVMRLNPEDMELKNDRGCTAFCYAVVSGVVANAKVMIIKNRNLSTIRAYDDMIPIHQAALLGHKEMVSFLCTVTPFQELIYQERIELLEATIRNDMYDEALNFFHKDRRLASARLKGNRSMLNLLARKLQALTTEKQEGVWRKFVGSTSALFSTPLQNSTQEQSSPTSCKARKLLEEMWEEYSNLTEKFAHLIRPQQILHCAAKEGNDQFLDMILHTNPDLLWELNEKRQSILHVAVLHRQEKVVRLICNIHGYKDFITLLEDKDRNNVLHLAAMTQTTFCRDNNENPLPDEQLTQRAKEQEKIMPQSLLRLSTAALQFDREISWFKDMENMMPPSLCDMLNDDDRTPKQLFSKEHMSLKIEGEKSIRDTAKSCMLVATLIATVTFSAIFTVPGGNHHEGAGAKKKTVFTVSDAVAMIYSMVSIVNFLSILILRYTEDNFHVALKRLFMGLAALGVSIAGMLVAFTAAFFLVYNKALVPILIAVFSGVPVALFWFLNTKLWFESTASMFRNLYRFIQQ
ncbi:uncharacterized protein LOC116027652 [Ipomoea triloba]|uniref:uncharacterized protein LOC116027652 n=1 Tax=Ipomoea triloba TaxID=35885 RepID=UPI00125E4701|nr:uncharacterized protein LOC116027652 [Ipomoea triloba]